MKIITKPGALSATIDVRGTATVECPVCGHENKHDVTFFFQQFGFNTETWGERLGLMCDKCDYPIDLSDGICVIESEGE